MRLKHCVFTLLVALLAISSATFAQEQNKYFTTSDGVRLHYRVSGSGTPLVIFPGFGQDVTKFEKNYPELDKHFTVYCLDYRGHGLSDLPEYGFHIERFAMDAKEMIDDAKLKKFYLFGHSMGNTVAWCYFSMFGQDQVLKYILGDEAPCLISNPVWTDDENESYTGSRERRELFTAFQFIGQDETNALKKKTMRRLLLDHLANDWRDIIPTIHVPTMIIMGGKSHFASQPLWDWMHTNIKDSRLEIMQDAGHGFYDSHPELFNKLAIDFLKN
jgi:pimeloyl-ACP methyl ester carboxylesterase